MTEKKCYKRRQECQHEESEEVEEDSGKDIRMVYLSEVQSLAYCTHEILEMAL